MLLVVAWDGATFDLIDPLIASGSMPVLASLIDSGASRPLRSTVPAATFPAWTSFMTAASPAHHGVTDFTIREGYAVRFVNATYRRLPTIWSLLSDAGARVGVYGFPATYPPEPLNGFQVCGFDTPLGAGAAARVTHPQTLAAEIIDRYGSLAIGGPSQARIEPGWHARALTQMLRTIDLRTRIACDRMAEEAFDCFAVHFAETDTVSHQFWHLCDRRSPRCPALAQAGPADPGDAVERVYRALDASLGRMLAAAGSRVDVMLISDHGSGGTSDRVVFWNRWLADHGWLAFRSIRLVPPRGAFSAEPR